MDERYIRLRRVSTRNREAGSAERGIEMGSRLSQWLASQQDNLKFHSGDPRLSTYSRVFRKFRLQDPLPSNQNGAIFSAATT